MDLPVQKTHLRDIFWLFFQIGIMSFGGGLSAWLFREIVEKRKWMTATEFLSGLTLVQALPGVNMTNMSVYVGQRLRGVPGVLIALFGLLVGPFFILIALSTAYRTIDDIPWSHAALAGLATSRPRRSASCSRWVSRRSVPSSRAWPMGSSFLLSS